MSERSYHWNVDFTSNGALQSCADCTPLSACRLLSLHRRPLQHGPVSFLDSRLLLVALKYRLEDMWDVHSTFQSPTPASDVASAQRAATWLQSTVDLAESGPAFFGCSNGCIAQLAYDLLEV